MNSAFLLGETRHTDPLSSQVFRIRRSSKRRRALRESKVGHARPLASQDSAAKRRLRVGKPWTANGFLDRIGAQRRKTASGSPKGEQSESINRINKIELSDSCQGKGRVQAISNPLSAIPIIRLIDSLRSPFGLPTAVFLRYAPILLILSKPSSNASW